MKKKIAGILAAVLLLCGCGGYPGPVFAAESGMDEYTGIRDGSYRPSDQGYYGYFPVCYGSEEDMTVIGVPALVKDGHTYLNAEDICQRLSMEYEKNPGAGTFSVSAWQRTVTFRENSAQCGIQIGPFLMEAAMPLATVCQDDVLWVGAEWFFWMTGGTFFPVADGYVAIGPPGETALDVVAELYSDYEAFDYGEAFGLSSEILEELDQALKRLDVYDGILNFEWDTLLAVLDRTPQGAFHSKTSMYDLITDSGYSADFMELLLQITPDEAYSIAETSENIGSWAVDKYLELMEKYYKRYSQEAKNLYTVASMRESMAISGNNYVLSQMLGRYSNEKICKSIEAAEKSDIFDALGKSAKTFSVLKDIVGCWNDYANRDTYAMEGARGVIDSLEESLEVRGRLGLPEMPLGMIRAMGSTLDNFERNQEGFTFTKWFVENIDDYVGDAVTGMMQVMGLPIELFQLGSRLVPAYVSALKGAEAFELSLIGVLYQPAAYSVFRGAADRCFRRRTPALFVRDKAETFEVDFDESALDETVAQAYHYVKARYVTRELALITLREYGYGKNQVCKAQAALQDRELERLKVVSDYCGEDLPVPSQWEEKAKGYDDSYLQALVTPAYVHVTGSFVNGQTGEAVGDISVSVRDQEENVMTEFVSGEDGAFDFYIPLQWKEESARRLQMDLERAEGEFLPWQEPYCRSFAYPGLQEEAPLIWLCSHPDYREFTRTFSDLEMVELEGAGASRELCLDTGKILLGIDYYQFIHDELLPEMGLASLETARTEVSSDESMSGKIGWDHRMGLVGADIADLNLDGVEDLLVYYIAEDTEYVPYAGSGCPQVLYADLYTVTGDGKITRMATKGLKKMDGVGYQRIKLGLMGLDDRVFLYVEEDSYAYFANGGSVTYTWYCWDKKGILRPRWMVGHTDGGSIGLASSLLDYYGEDSYDKYVLCADGDFRYSYPDVEVLTDEEDGYAYETEWPLRAGFAMLGLDAVGTYEGSPNGYFTQVGRLPTCWGTELMKESVGYLCAGEKIAGEQSRTRYVIRRMMTTSMEDRTRLGEKMAELDAAE